MVMAYGPWRAVGDVGGPITIERVDAPGERIVLRLDTDADKLLSLIEDLRRLDPLPRDTRGDVVEGT